MSQRHIFSKPPLAYRLLRHLGWSTVVGLGLSIFLVILFSVVPPPLSGVMIERWLEAKINNKPPPFAYHWRPLAKITPTVGLAAVTSEDQLFANHFGFDWEAIAKAYEYNQIHRKLRGASTISQQTAKNLFLWDGRSWLRKGLEAYFTLLIEGCWTKQRILEVYLNIIEFGDGIYGVEAASQHYFHKTALNLTSNEAALLIAVLPNPHLLHVDNPSPIVIERQQWILNNMGRLGGAQYIKNL